MARVPRARLVVVVVPLLVAWPRPGDARADEAPRWSAEVNVSMPFVPGGLFEGRVLRALWEEGDLRGEAFVGVHSDFSNTKRDVEGDRFDMGPQVGYRQYLWKGLHLQAYLNAVYAEVHDDVADGRNHASFVLLAGALAGYRVEVGPSLYVMAQAGAADRVFYSNPWPHPAGEGAFPLGGLLFGARF